MKAIIFDLDDTLYDCTGSLLIASRKRAAKSMVQSGLPCTEEEAYIMQEKFAKSYGPSNIQVITEIAGAFGRNSEFIKNAVNAYNSNEVSDIKLFPDVIPTLKQLAQQNYMLFLLSTGIHERQQKKIETLKLEPFFDEIVINDQEVGLLLKDCFEMILEKHQLKPRNVVVVGDRVKVELKVAKSFGMTTVQMLHGRFMVETASDFVNKPDYKIKRIFQLPTALKLKRMKKTRDKLKIVAIGGGTGLPIALEGLKTFSSNLTAIVTVTDSGRSSGIIREEYGILPPGDARNCLIALSETEEQEDLYRLFQYRFNKGALNGMSLGNLLMTALTDITGSFELAIKKASEILSIKGKVLPSMLTSTHICARLEDGTIVEEEFNVRAPKKSPIEKLFLRSDNIECPPEAISEICNADVVIIGPGSLYTSIISNLLVEDIKESLKKTEAVKIYICNIVTQPGQTDKYTASDCVKSVIKYLGEGILDYVLINNNIPNDSVLVKYRKEGADIITIDKDLATINVDVETEDLIENIDLDRILWEKQDLIRHDPDKLANSICKLYSSAIFEES
ncbi:MAG: uridine diphosphate-N-acetylglucosamine-binding protein YvcK [Planctomycetes bacterium]|nr:uridine diphosphate-N-acetylglucosamine-binding protein YvcK [Planctomycetota bacterium]